VELQVLIEGENYVVKDPKVIVEYAEEHGIIKPLIEGLEKSLELLEGLEKLEELGLIKQTAGIPTATLIDGNRKLLNMLREALSGLLFSS